MATVKGILRSFELVESFKLSKGQKVPFKIHFDVEVLDLFSLDIENHPERVQEFDEKVLLSIGWCWRAFIKKLIMHISTKCVGHFEDGNWKVEIAENDRVAQLGFEFFEHDMRDRSSDIWRVLNRGQSQIERKL